MGGRIGPRLDEGPFWIEPFFASLQISESGEEIIAYEIRFGDKAKGLGTTPYGKHIRRADWYFPNEWLFEFSRKAND